MSCTLLLLLLLLQLLAVIMASRVLDKKLKKVLDMRTDTPALLESLEAISTLINDHSSSSASSGTPAAVAAGDGERAGGVGHEYSTLDARRSLREDLERQVCVLTLCSIYVCTYIRSTYIHRCTPDPLSSAERLHSSQSCFCTYEGCSRARRRTAVCVYVHVFCSAQ